MRTVSRRHAVTTVVTVVLSLMFAQLPNTSAPAISLPYCIGAAAYPPEAVGSCLDPVSEAQRIAAENAVVVARAAASASAAAAAQLIQAELDRVAQQLILEKLKDGDITAAASKAAELSDAAEKAAERARANLESATAVITAKQDAISAALDSANQLADEVKAQNAKAARLQQEAIDQQIEIDKALDKAAKLLEDYKKIEADLLREIADANERVSIAIKAADNAKQKQKDLEDKISSARSDLKTAQGDILRLQTQIDNYSTPGASLRTSAPVQLNDISLTTSESHEEKFVVATPTLDQLKAQLGEAQGRESSAQSSISVNGPLLETAKSDANTANTNLGNAKSLQTTAVNNQKDAAGPSEAAAREAESAKNLKIQKDNEAKIAQTAALRAEQARTAALQAAEQQKAELLSAQAAAEAAEAAKAAAEARAAALAQTVIQFENAKNASGDSVKAAEALLKVTQQIQIANNQSENLKIAAAKSQEAAAQSQQIANNAAQRTQAALDNQNATQEALRNPPQQSNQNDAYAQLVIANRNALAELEAAKAAEEKAKAEAEAAKAAAEKAAADANQTALDAARKKADEAKAEADRLAAKAVADAAAADAKVAAAIEAAKAKAQEIINGIRSSLSKLAAKAASEAAKYRNQADQSSAKADAATKVMNDANDKATRTAEIAAAVATELQTATNQVILYQSQLKDTESKEKSLQKSIATKQQSLDSLVKEFEKVRIDNGANARAYLQAQSLAAAAAENAVEKKNIAILSKKTADDAVTAYKAAAGIKSLISTEKPYSVESADAGIHLQTTASAEEIAKLKKLADQAVARYNLDQKAADLAVKDAADAMANLKKVKATLDAGLALGKALQEKIQAFADQMNTDRQTLAETVVKKNGLNRKIQVSQVLVTSKLNDLTIAQVEAQKAKVTADKATLTVTKHRTDAATANKIAAANEAAIEAAKQAALAVTDSSNSIDKIVASKLVNDSIATLPVILTAVAVVVAGFFATLAIRRRRQGAGGSLPTFTEPDLDTARDFDRIKAEVKNTAVKRKPRVAATKSATKVASKTTTVRKAAPKKSAVKKAAPKKR